MEANTTSIKLSTTKRRGRGDGSLALRADGRWQGRITVAPGRRRYVYGRTKAEAQRKPRRMPLGGAPIANTTMTMERFLGEWLASRKPFLRPTTHLSYVAKVKTHMLHPEYGFGAVKVALLKPSHIDKMTAGMARAGAAGTTQDHCRKIVRSAPPIRRRLISNFCASVLQWSSSV